MHGNETWCLLLLGELFVVHLYLYDAAYELDVHCFIPWELYETIIHLLYEYYSTKINTYIYPPLFTDAESAQSKSTRRRIRSYSSLLRKMETRTY
jgi:hypothetical protein